MRSTQKLFLFILLAAAILWPQTVLAQGPTGDEFVVGGVYSLDSGETLNGNLYIFGGVATLEEGSLVNGSIVLAGGTLRVSGEVNGDINATGGTIRLRDPAVVRGDVNLFAATFDRDPGAQVDGDINTGLSGQFIAPSFDDVQPPVVPSPQVRVSFEPLWRLFWLFAQSFLWAALAILVVLFLPKHTERVVQAAVTQPVLAGGMGLLTAIVFPLLLVLLAITIIGIPASLLGALLFAVAWAYGVVALSLEVGRRLTQTLNQDWALPVSAGIGAFVLTLVINGIDFVLPCIGWIPEVLVGMLGLGAVLLTYFGTRSYPPRAPYLSEGGPPPPPPVEAPPPARYPETEGPGPRSPEEPSGEERA